ncbi:MAG TPA: hypothetical protein VFW40_00190, partial [Capsulimonadaceae bacterium]|nr:hypothetical protein [Capsulimonadaceae bacterium]
LKGNRAEPKSTSISKVMSDIAKDAREGRIGFADSKSFVIDQLEDILEDEPDRLKSALADVGKTREDDFHRLGNVFNRWATPGWMSKKGFAAKTAYSVRSGLLSGPKTFANIVVSHGLVSLYEEGVNATAALATGGKYAQFHPLADYGAALKAVAKAIPEAGRIIKQGMTAAELRGVSPYYRPSDLPHVSLTREPVSNALGLRLPIRMHAAAFHVFGQMAEATYRRRLAGLWAKRLGGKWQDHMNDPDVIKGSREIASELIYSNPNAVAEGITGLERGIDKGMADIISKATNTKIEPAPIAKTIGAIEAPFRRVPLNIAGRGLEYSGIGSLYAGAKYAIARKAMREMQPNDLFLFKAGLTRSAVRGVLGPASLGTVGYYLASRGVLNPPNAKEHEWGSVNYHGRRYGISRFAPVATPVELAGETYLYLHGKDADFLTPFSDTPFSTAADQFNQVREAGGQKGKMSEALAKDAGETLSAFVPTLLSQIASATDPHGTIRVKKGILGASMNRIPGLREKLNALPYPQPSNLKSTGAKSLLYPVDVYPTKGYNAH